jgi:hypothetical protein
MKMVWVPAGREESPPVHLYSAISMVRRLVVIPLLLAAQGGSSSAGKEGAGAAAAEVEPARPLLGAPAGLQQEGGSGAKALAEQSGAEAAHPMQLVALGYERVVSMV